MMTEKSYIGNPVIDLLPAHLKQFVKPQNYEQYSPIDQAVWRYVMRKNVNYLKDIAHESYLQGLEKTGISVDKIPSMYGMNRILKEIGWAAVAVDGFIPPAAFMDFQAYNVLVIASDMRSIDHIEYTPAPDIIHESAGHAPIIANPEYAEFLRHFGEIGAKAIANKKDYELYEAIRHLSIIKEAPGTSESEIDNAEQKIAELTANLGEPSEMTLLRRLHWWTVEYGLIGTLENPKIYGAGLLSSIGESSWCLTDNVKKIPLTIEAAYQDYDITKPQPQLFVTPDFAHLSLVLEEFTNTLSMRKGGLAGVKKLISSDSIGTIELSTGLQISGVFTNVIEHEGKPIFIETQSLTSLAYREKELIGHGTQSYNQGFVSPIGKLKGINLAIEDMSPRDLKYYDIYEGHTVQLDFEGGVSLQGEVITGTRNIQGKIMLITFRNCTVTYQYKQLFDPSMGNFHLAVGKEVISAFNGPADLKSFTIEGHVPTEQTIHIKRSEKTLQLENLYQQVRSHREGKEQIGDFVSVLNKLKKEHPMDWLLPLELLEIAQKDVMAKEEIYDYIEILKNKLPQKKHLIETGVDMIHPKTLK